MSTVHLRTFRGMDGQTWIDGYRARLAEIGRVGARCPGPVGDGSTASSRDGTVAVTVDAIGVVRRVLFGPETERMSRTQLGDAVVEAAGRARAQAGRDAAAWRAGVP
jgi:hypothetical protein